jgi:chaperonin cofactor prefoldin
MENYCECCEYKTNLTANFKKHLMSKKHIQVSQKFVKVSLELVKVRPKAHVCKYCEKEYKHRSSLSNHIKYSCNKNTDEDLKELVRLLNQRIETQDKQIETQNKKIEKLMGN